MAKYNTPYDSNFKLPMFISGAQMPFVAALAVVIGVCVVGMSYMVYQKKRGKTAQQYKPLFIDEEK